MDFFVLLALAACALAAVGCGVQGEPLPPLLNVPLRAEIAGVQRGSRALLSWQMPAQTTEGQAVRPDKLGPVEVYRAALPGLRAAVSLQEFQAAAQRIAQLPPLQTQYVEELPRERAGGTLAYAVRLLNRHGDAAGFSNIAAIPVLAALPAPPRLRAEPTEKAVVVEWPAVPGAAAYHLYRAEEPQPDRGSPSFQLLARVPAPDSTTQPVRYPDPDFAFDRRYRYFVRAVGVRGPFQAESEDSPPVAIRPEDTFPPGVPGGLVAVVTAASGGAPVVELTWEPNTEADLAGYAVFRGENGGAVRRLNSNLLQSPAFRDENVRAGTAYTYAVSAVDQKGNESARSEAVTVKP